MSNDLEIERLKEITESKEKVEWLRNREIPNLMEIHTLIGEKVTDLKKELEHEPGDSPKASKLEKEIRKQLREARKIEKKAKNAHNEIKSLEEKIKALEVGEIERQKQVAKEEDKIRVFETVSAIARSLWKDTTILAEEHTLAADSWGGYHFLLGILATALSAAVGAGIFSESGIFVIIAGILSLILVIISAVGTFLNSEQRSISHHKAGTSFRVLSNRAQLLVDIDLKLRKKSDEELANQLKKLSDERDELLINSPRVSSRHYKAATQIWDMAEKERARALVLDIPLELDTYDNS